MNGLWKEVGYMGTSGNRDCRWASRGALKDFTEDALNISAAFEKGGIAVIAEAVT